MEASRCASRKALPPSLLSNRVQASASPLLQTLTLLDMPSSKQDCKYLIHRSDLWRMSKDHRSAPPTLRRRLPPYQATAGGEPRSNLVFARPSIPTLHLHPLRSLLQPIQRPRGRRSTTGATSLAVAAAAAAPRRWTTPAAEVAAAGSATTSRMMTHREYCGLLERI